MKLYTKLFFMFLSMVVWFGVLAVCTATPLAILIGVNLCTVIIVVSFVIMCLIVLILGLML